VAISHQEIDLKPSWRVWQQTFAKAFFRMGKIMAVAALSAKKPHIL
jgi:hypothetical protein